MAVADVLMKSAARKAVPVTPTCAEFCARPVTPKMKPLTASDAVSATATTRTVAMIVSTALRWFLVLKSDLKVRKPCRVGSVPAFCLAASHRCGLWRAPSCEEPPPVKRAKSYLLHLNNHVYSVRLLFLDSTLSR